MTNKLIGLAACLSLALTATHVFGGGPDVHIPLLESNATQVVKGFASVVWHGVTATLLLCSAMLLIAAKNQKFRLILTWLVIAHYLAFTALFLFYGIMRFGTAFIMMPWIGFAVIVVVAFVGLSLDKGNPKINTQPVGG